MHPNLVLGCVVAVDVGARRETSLSADAFAPHVVAYKCATKIIDEARVLMGAELTADGVERKMHVARRGDNLGASGHRVRTKRAKLCTAHFLDFLVTKKRFLYRRNRFLK
jgi:hypothetical protein